MVTVNAPGAEEIALLRKGATLIGLLARGLVPNCLRQRFEAGLSSPTTWLVRRFEHWTTVIEQAAIVAQNILAGVARLRIAYESVPYFWSDQLGARSNRSDHPTPTSRSSRWGNGPPGDLRPRRVSRWLPSASRAHVP
ncbi:hypothetical protein [Amycolatopsis sp. NPDC051371]|uniref:hypothetical protein n=1 Tax=Amycolatopsis sp. NPDC051371 TaxID=3155800 RepID=UPI003438A39D